MALHPQCEAFLAPGADAPELMDIPIATGRAGSYADMTISGPLTAGVAIINRFIPGESADILIRIYTPTGRLNKEWHGLLSWWRLVILLSRYVRRTIERLGGYDKFSDCLY